MRGRFGWIWLCTFTAACGGSATAPVDTPTLTTLLVVITDSSLDIGQTATLSAQGLDQDAHPITLSSAPTYTAAPGGVVTISGNVVTAVGEGAALITGSAAGVVGVVAVLVSAPASTLEMVPAADIAKVASDLYDALEAGDDPTGLVSGILESLLPVLSGGDEALADELIADGKPFVLDGQAALLARGYEEGALTSLESFIAAATEAGAVREDGGPLSRAYLTGGLAPLIGQASYGADDAAAIVILMLGQERASRRPGGITDPVWGDDWLDPLQTLLLLYAVEFSGTQPSAASLGTAAPLVPVVTSGTALGSPVGAPVLPGWVQSLGKRGIRSLIVGRIGRFVEVPLTWGQAAKVSVCASILMYGHQFEVTADRTQVHYAHPEGGAPPRDSHITASLKFDFVPTAFGAWVLPRIGCDLPPPGPAADKNVEWTVRDPLTEHGALTEQDAKTNGEGKALATYEAATEVWPAELRALEQSADGTIDVRATGLVPGWSNLERAVGIGVLNPTDAGIRLFVQYHEPPPAFSVTFTSRLRAEVLTGSFDLAGSIVGRIDLQDGWRELGRVYYTGNIRFEYTTVSGPPCTSGDGPIPTTWVGAGSLMEARLQQPLALAPGETPELGFAIGPTEAGDLPMEQVTCGGQSTSQSMWLSLWSFARLKDLPWFDLRGWTIVSPGVLKKEIHALFDAPGFTLPTEDTVVILTAVYEPAPTPRRLASSP